MDKVRIDKWLWAARFVKTRALAAEIIHKGHVQVNGNVCKASREVRIGDRIVLMQLNLPRTMVVLGLSTQRASASIAAQLYEETPESQALRAAAAQQHRLSPEPALTIAGGRPTKRDRRDLQKTWGNRWSASLD